MNSAQYSRNSILEEKYQEALRALEEIVQIGNQNSINGSTANSSNSAKKGQIELLLYNIAVAIFFVTNSDSKGSSVVVGSRSIMITKKECRKEKVKAKQSQIDIDDEFLSFKQEPKPKRVSIQSSVQVGS